MCGAWYALPESCTSCVIQITLALNSRRAVLQRETQGLKNAQRIVQTFPLFSVVLSSIKQFSGTYFDRSFRAIYTSRQLVQI